MAVISSHCQNLKVPFVRVMVKVEDCNKEVHSHAFEMSIAEFKVCFFFVLFVCLFVCFFWGGGGGGDLGFVFAFLCVCVLF